MMRNEEILVVPKVRFRQSDRFEESRKVCRKEDAVDKGTIVTGPRIKSDVLLKKKVKIVLSKPPKECVVPSVTNNDLEKLPSQRTLSNVNVVNMETFSPRLFNNSNVRDNLASKEIIIQKDSYPRIPCIDLSSESEDDDLVAVLPTSKYRSILQSHNFKNCEAILYHSRKENFHGKENKNGNASFAGVQYSGRTTVNGRLVPIKLDVKYVRQSTGVQVPKQVLKSTKPSSIASKSAFTRNNVKKSAVTVINAMPCLKNARGQTNKNVKAPVITKTVEEQIKQCNKPKSLFTKSNQKEKTDRVPDKCIQDKTEEKQETSELNSIIQNLNKLNMAKKDKFVTDSEHLPLSYKSLVQEKISSVLDFPLDEAIYKNLINLSIDERQLPSRLTRTKDPEPREKDVVPKLSSFFTPEATEEYCTAICVKSHSPEIIDHWDAFKISNKIFNWKSNLDM